jgi:hypothetical protein
MFALKIFCFFIGILLSYSNTLNWEHYKEVHGALVILQAAGITGFITLQWLV